MTNKHVPTGAERYGRYYYVIVTKAEVISMYADEVRVLPDGTLLLSYRLRLRAEGDLHPGHAFAPGQWERFFAASVMDGCPVGVLEARDRPKKTAPPARAKPKLVKG
jgi:hypothetical protein